jgi:hypothetical protein
VLSNGRVGLGDRDRQRWATCLFGPFPYSIESGNISYVIARVENAGSVVGEEFVDGGAFIDAGQADLQDLLPGRLLPAVIELLK